MNEALIAAAKKYRKLIEKAVQSLDDKDALECVCLYQKWNGNGIAYAKDTKVQDEGVLYNVITAHTSQADWKPKNTPSLFAKVLIPDPTIVPEWEQPESTNPYMKGDKVMCDGKKWQSTIDNNVWKPGVYGWEEISE